MVHVRDSDISKLVPFLLVIRNRVEVSDYQLIEHGNEGRVIESLIVNL